MHLLEELCISFETLAVVEIKCLLECVYYNRTLKLLDLSNNELSKETVATIGELLEINTCLEKLVLSHNVISGHIVHLAQGLTKNVTLKHLFLSDCKIDEENSIGFFKVLTRCKLETLDISSNQISCNEGKLSPLIMYLHNNNYIKEINLSFNLIINSILDVVFDVIRDNTCFKKLTFEHPPLSYNNIRSLSKCKYLKSVSVKVNTNDMKLVNDLVQHLKANTTLTEFNLKIGKDEKRCITIDEVFNEIGLVNRLRPLHKVKLVRNYDLYFRSI
jgi:hypothetical protein